MASYTTWEKKWNYKLTQNLFEKNTEKTRLIPSQNFLVSDPQFFFFNTQIILCTNTKLIFFWQPYTLNFVTIIGPIFFLCLRNIWLQFTPPYEKVCWLQNEDENVEK